MSFTAWLLFISLMIADVGAYIYMTLQLKKIERFEADLYRDISEVYREIDELERKYKEMYHDNTKSDTSEPLSHNVDYYEKKYNLDVNKYGIQMR